LESFGNRTGCQRWGASLDLIEQIWDSLPDQVEPQDVPDWHVAELAKRRASAAESPGVGKPWREVLERLEGGS